MSRRDKQLLKIIEILQIILIIGRREMSRESDMQFLHPISVQ